MTSHVNFPGDFCFVRSDELREALNDAYVTTQRHNLWHVFRTDGPYVFLSHLIEMDPITDAFRALAYRYMTRISIYGWDAFVEYYKAEMQKPRQPCLLYPAAATETLTA